MSSLQWSAELALDMPVMDQTHREFVDLLAALEHAGDAQLIDAAQALITHTEQHFAQEDAWMHDSPCGSTGCHTNQHRVVLHVMNECLRLAGTGQLDVLRELAKELAVWFPQHAMSMDAALAAHLDGLALDSPAQAAAHRDAPRHERSGS
jgi:hemerythrin-like metal-binding protein